jgi:hypothetical protein
MSKNKYNDETLECILCGKEFGLNELFICHFKPGEKEDTITVCQCLGHEVSEQKEKVGGWGVVQRNLSGYQLIKQT